MRKEIREYTDQWGQRIQDVADPTDYGRGWFLTRSVFRDGMWQQIGPLVFTEVHPSMIHDDKTDRNFGLAFACPFCEKGWHSSKQLVAECDERIAAEKKIVTAETAALAADKLVEALGGNTSFVVPSGVTTSSHLWGGGGGTGKTEVVPYPETSCSPCDNTTTFSGPATILSPKGMVLVDGATYVSRYDSYIWISTGCKECDYLLKNQSVLTEQRAYEKWYDHYIEAQEGYKDGFVITHLEFIMREMMKWVTEETKLPAILKKESNTLPPVIGSIKTPISRIDKFWYLLGAPAILTFVCTIVSLWAVAIVCMATGHETISKQAFVELLIGLFSGSLVGNYVAAIVRYRKARK